MPKFIYTVTLLGSLFWWILIKILTTQPPNSTRIILLFLVLLLFTISLTLSLPIFFYLRKKSPDFTNIRFMYRKAFKMSWVYSFFLVGFLGLRAFDLASPFNITLFLILCVMIVLQRRKIR
jgi:hypothetical protein